MRDSNTGRTILVAQDLPSLQPHSLLRGERSATPQTYFCREVSISAKNLLIDILSGDEFLANLGESMQMTPIMESGKEEVDSASRYLKARGIDNRVTLAEDCKPGT